MNTPGVTYFAQVSYNLRRHFFLMLSWLSLNMIPVLWRTWPPGINFTWFVSSKFGLFRFNLIDAIKMFHLRLIFQYNLFINKLGLLILIKGKLVFACIVKCVIISIALELSYAHQIFKLIWKKPVFACMVNVCKGFKFCLCNIILPHYN